MSAPGRAETEATTAAKSSAAASLIVLRGDIPRLEYSSLKLKLEWERISETNPLFFRALPRESRRALEQGLIWRWTNEIRFPRCDIHANRKSCSSPVSS